MEISELSARLVFNCPQCQNEISINLNQNNIQYGEIEYGCICYIEFQCEHCNHNCDIDFE